MAWDIDIPDVVAGQPVASSWGNLIRNRVVHIVASQAALPTDVADGSVAFVTATSTLWWRTGGTWAQLGWREIRGLTAMTLPASTEVVTQNVNFPAGLFTAGVIGLVTARTTNNNLITSIGTTSTTSAVIRAVWRTAGQGPASQLNFDIAWKFWQV